MRERDTIVKVIEQVRADKGLSHRTLSDEDLLMAGLELDSLDMATIVAELEAALGLDPFADDTPRFETLGEFVRLYGSD